MTTSESSPQRVELSIRGMHCAGCVAAVESALTKTPGVARAQVNLATERAVVELASDARAEQCRDDLIRAVSSAGYQAEPYEP
ncbi:MAG: heavy-metal-associated domain-containing protein, partial [Planctomycetota bacterium]